MYCNINVAGNFLEFKGAPQGRGGVFRIAISLFDILRQAILTKISIRLGGGGYQLM